VQLGLGSPAPINSLPDQFDGTLSLLWVDATTGKTLPRPATVMAKVTQKFAPNQLSAVEKLNDTLKIMERCRPNFSGFSSCYAGIVFNDASFNGTAYSAVNYTILGDGGLIHVDVVKHDSDFERRIFPLQWALDKVPSHKYSSEKRNL